MIGANLKKPTRAMWLGNLPGALQSEQLLIEACGQFGSIESVRINQLKRFAFVNFYKLEDAVTAVETLVSQGQLNGFKGLRVRG